MSNRLLNLAWLVPLPAPTKLLLIALADRADDGGKSWPSREMLCDQTGLSPASVSQHVQALIANGLLTQQRRRQRSAEYALDERALILASEAPAVVAVADPVPKMSSSKTSTSYTSTNKMSTSADQDVQLLDIPKENPHRTPSNTSSKRGRASKRNRTTGDEDFDAFWAVYPRKVDKQDALQAYAKALKLAEPPRLLAAVKAHASYWAKAGREAENIPHAATWLNRQRWEDELDPQHVPRGDPDEWLREQWRRGRIGDIHQVYRSGYTPPDNPGLDAEAYHDTVLTPYNRQWITDHHDQIIAQLATEAS